jgi:hypothetical protein
MQQTPLLKALRQRPPRTVQPAPEGLAAAEPEGPTEEEAFIKMATLLRAVYEEPEVYFKEMALQLALGSSRCAPDGEKVVSAMPRLLPFQQYVVFSSGKVAFGVAFWHCAKCVPCLSA